MQRDINYIRDLETGGKNKETYDIIFKKKKIKEILESDPDIVELLGVKEPRPLNQFADKDNPTPDELKLREEIETYNLSITHEQIVPWLKLNNIQKEVLNFIMFDIRDDHPNYDNTAVKEQYIDFMILVHQNDMDTEYEVPRVDLLDQIVRDLFSRSNIFSGHAVPFSDNPSIVDDKYYCRTVTFHLTVGNGLFRNGNNPYDRFGKI